MRGKLASFFSRIFWCPSVPEVEEKFPHEFPSFVELIGESITLPRTALDAYSTSGTEPLLYPAQDLTPFVRSDVLGSSVSVFTKILQGVRQPTGKVLVKTPCIAIGVPASTALHEPLRQPCIV